jgi:uncharacterized protein YecT (DUF1311 family)
VTYLSRTSSRRLALAVCGVWLGAAGLAASPAPAQAEDVPAANKASFNCERAVLLDERLICSDTLLSQADLELGRAYRALLDATKDAARIEELHSDQQAWVLRRNGECGVFKSTLPKTSEWPGYVDCFLDAYEERAGDLRRMAANPTTPPSEIALPIRKSLLGLAPEQDPSLKRFLVGTGITLPADPVSLPLRWLDDDRLIAVDVATQEGDGTHALVLWSARTNSVGRTGASVPAQWHRALCATTGAIYISGMAGAAGTELRRFAIDGAGHAIAAPPGEVARGGCAAEVPALLDGRVLATDPTGGSSLYLGTTSRGRAAGGLRDVMEQRAGHPSAPVAPPIRIDSRFGLGGRYLPFLKSFLVWYEPGRLQRIQWQVAQRRWAKADCLAYWLVDPESGRAETRCIPFGGYNEARPVPVVAKSGAFFLVAPAAKPAPGDGWFGFYALRDGHAQRVAPGAFISASTSPDGCRIALVDAASEVSVFDACAAFP